MKRAMLDTNVYGEILVDRDIDKIKKSVQKSGLIFYGNRLIKKELKEAPKASRRYEKNLRMDLLRLFDEIVKEHILDITEEMRKLAEAYYVVYRELKGSLPKARLINDFIIIACATVKALDIVVSEDNKTMLSPQAIRSYEIVNKLFNKRTPNFMDYKIFKEKLFGRGL